MIWFGNGPPGIQVPIEACGSGVQYWQRTRPISMRNSTWLSALS